MAAVSAWWLRLPKLASANLAKIRTGMLRLTERRRIILGLVLLLIIAVVLHRSLSRHVIATSPSRNQLTQATNPAPRTPVLEILSVNEYGSIIEIQGKSEPGTTVMINGEKVGLIWDGDTFKHFVGPFPEGPTTVTITAQNEDGGVNTKQVPLNIK